jgi:AraC family transcriptional regulator
MLRTLSEGQVTGMISGQATDFRNVPTHISVEVSHVGDPSRQTAATEVVGRQATRRILDGVHIDSNLGDRVSTSAAEWTGMSSMIRRIKARDPWEVRLTASTHAIALILAGARRDGETAINGSEISHHRHPEGKLVFVPCGATFTSWVKPASDYHVAWLHLDPTAPFIDPQLQFGDMDFPTALYQDVPTIARTVRTISDTVEKAGSALRIYAESLGAVLAVELMMWRDGGANTDLLKVAVRRGGLASWQERRVKDYIQEHYARNITLNELAELVRLSPFHFCRAFKTSFGLPPHRYLLQIRVERSKALLANRALSIDAIAYATGFTSSSQFSTVFRKSTGRTAGEYRRSLV